MNNAIIFTNRLLWCVGVFFLSLLACKKDDAPQPVPEPELPGVSYLGRGYNIFGDYAVPNDVKSPIVQFDQYQLIEARNKTYRIPEAADFLKLESNKFTSIYGNQSDEFQRNLTVLAGGDAGIPFFGGGITALFASSQYGSSSYAFVEVQNVISLWKLSLPRDAATLRSMATPEFKTDLDNMAPQAFFAKYGTHVLTEFVVGAKAFERSAVLKTEKTKTLNLGLAAEVFFKVAIGEIDLNVQTQYQEMVQVFREYATRHYDFFGGKAEYGTYITQHGNYAKWIESIEDNAVLCDFTDQSLLPVWELTPNQARKNELLQAFNNLVVANTLDPAPTNLSITNVAVAAFADMPNCPDEQAMKELGLEGYNVLCGNLNDGTPIKGWDIYLFYKTGTADEVSVTDLSCIQHAGTPTPPGFEKLETNLNLWAGGIWIYLCQKKELSSDPIRQLRVIKGAGAPLPDGFEWVLNHSTGEPQDLNNGTWGTPIWLAYSREVPEW